MPSAGSPPLSWPNRKDTRRSLRRDRDGFIGVMFALTLIPILGSIGLAIEWGHTAQTKARLDTAADSAAMAAATAAAGMYVNVPGTTADAAIAYGQTVGDQVFNTITMPDLTYADPKPTNGNKNYVQLTQVGAGQFKAILSYTAHAPSYLGKLFTVDQYSVGGSSTVVTNAESDQTFLLALDNSESMMIGATQVDQGLLSQLFLASSSSILMPGAYGADSTGYGPSTASCGFACHWQDASGNPTTDYYAVAENSIKNGSGIKIRLDVVRDAAISAISTLAQANSSAQIGVITFAEKSQPLTKAWPPASDNFANIQNALASLGPSISATVNAVNHAGNTDLGGPLTTTGGVLADITNNYINFGTGQKNLILVTDGVNDMEPQTYVRMQMPPVVPNVVGTINVAKCTALKKMGVTIAVVRITFDSVYQSAGDDTSNPDATFYALSNLMTPELIPAPSMGLTGDADGTALKACVSAPNLYVQADTPDQINSAIKSVFQTLTAPSARFTQ